MKDSKNTLHQDSSCQQLADSCSITQSEYAPKKRFSVCNIDTVSSVPGYCESASDRLMESGEGDSQVGLYEAGGF